MTLIDLLRPISFEQFAGEFQGRQFFCLDPEDARRFDRLMPWSSLDRLLEQQTLRPGRIRVIRDGHDLPGPFYRKADGHESIDAVKLNALLEQGASIVVNCVQHIFPEIGRLAQDIELHLGETVNVNAYVSIGHGGAFRAHYDTHDVFVLQVHGSKRWQILDEPESFPLKGQRQSVAGTRRAVLEKTLMPGAVLYVPRGVYHRADVDVDRSAHLTVGINTRKGVDFLAWMHERLADDPLFRQDLPLSGGSDALAAHEAGLRQRMVDALAGASLAEFVADGDRRRAPIGRFNMGPRPAVSRERLLRPLVRRRGPQDFATSKSSDNGASADLLQRVLDYIVARRAAPLADVESALAGAAPAAAVDAAVESLILRGFVEVES